MHRRRTHHWLVVVAFVAGCGSEDGTANAPIVQTSTTTRGDADTDEASSRGSETDDLMVDACPSGPLAGQCMCDAELSCTPTCDEDCIVECSAQSICELGCGADRSCELECTDSATCSSTCGQGELCDVHCEGSAQCETACGQAEDCRTTCDDSSRCNVQCEDAATSCTVLCGSSSECTTACGQAQDCDVYCQDSALCTLNCGAAEGCAMTCPDEASCVCEGCQLDCGEDREVVACPDTASRFACDAADCDAVLPE